MSATASNTYGSSAPTSGSGSASTSAAKLPAAENVAESLTRGARVIVQGRLKQRSYETREGEKRTVYEVEVDEVGPSLRNATALSFSNAR